MDAQDVNIVRTENVDDCIFRTWIVKDHPVKDLVAAMRPTESGWDLFIGEETSKEQVDECVQLIKDNPEKLFLAVPYEH